MYSYKYYIKHRISITLVSFDLNNKNTKKVLRSNCPSPDMIRKDLPPGMIRVK